MCDGRMSEVYLCKHISAEDTKQLFANWAS